MVVCEKVVVQARVVWNDKEGELLESVMRV